MSKRVKVTVKKFEVKSQNSLSRKQKTNSSKSPGSPVNHTLHLQRTLGNQVVQRMMKSGALQAKLRNSTSCPVSPRRCPFGGACHTCPARVQAKLKIGQPNDKYEQEADRVADQVMRMPDIQRSPGCVSCGEREEAEPIRTKPLAGQITPLVQRQVEPEEEEEEPIQTKALSEQITPLVQRQVEEEEEEEPLQTKLVDGGQVQRQEEEPEEEEEEPIQTKQSSGQTPHGSRGVEAQIHSMEGGGQPLPASVRAFFEPKFGYDFSQVRVHTGANAAKSARALNSRAFTMGQNVVFGAGQYAPETSNGQRLLAHELTHTIQQDGGQSMPRGAPGCMSEPLIQCQRPVGVGVLPGTPARPLRRLDRATLRRFTRAVRNRNYSLAVREIARMMERRGEIDPRLMVTRAVPRHHIAVCRRVNRYVLSSTVSGAVTHSCGCFTRAGVRVRLPNPRILINFTVLQTTALSTRHSTPFVQFLAELVHSTLLHEFRHVRQDFELCNTSRRSFGVCTDCNNPEEMDAYLAEIEAGYNPAVYRRAWVRVYTNWGYLSPRQQAVFRTRRNAALRRIRRAFPGVSWARDREVLNYARWCRTLDRRLGGGTRGRCSNPMAPP